MHTSYGDMDIAIPRDRKGTFEPQVIKKYQNTVTQDMEEKIISTYAKGMTTGDIESHLQELYDIDVSDSSISRITDKILPIVREWQERPLEAVYAVVFMDAIHFHVRSEGRIVKRAVYIAIGIDMYGRKDVLGMYVGENESAKFWLSIHEWTQKSWYRGYPNCVCRWTYGISASHWGSISPNRSAALYHSSDTKFDTFCFLQGSKNTNDRLKACICSSYGRNRFIKRLSELGFYNSY